MGGERERIRAAYDRRGTPELADRYQPWEPANLFLVQKRELALLDLLVKHRQLPVGDRCVLDVGCGSGHVLNQFLVYGAKLDNLAGVDLLDTRVSAGREVNPHLDIRVADATDLPFADETFDVVLAFTLFSSIKSPRMRLQVAEEMQRVVRPDGGILWYDFWINPVNRDTESLRLREIRRLFPGARVDARHVTLAPPLVRAFIPHSRLLCELLEKLVPLRTHWLAWISPRPRGEVAA
jgi:SAM-dependent methyltransferase